MTGRTVVITANLPSADTPNIHCTPETARRGLVELVAQHAPDLIGLQEFGVKPECDGMYFTAAHPVVGMKTARYGDFREHRVLLAKGRTVEPEKGRRTFLPDVYATVVEAVEKATGNTVGVSNTHLPAHVEVKGVYRKIKDHLTGRSAMHRQARRKWRRDAQARAKRLDDMYLTADPNFELMRLRSFVSCWAGHRTEHTFGPRTIDAVWARRHAARVATVKIPSDHHAVKATY